MFYNVFLCCAGLIFFSTIRPGRRPGGSSGNINTRYMILAAPCYDVLFRTRGKSN